MPLYLIEQECDLSDGDIEENYVQERRLANLPNRSDVHDNRQVLSGENQRPVQFVEQVVFADFRKIVNDGEG